VIYTAPKSWKRISEHWGWALEKRRKRGQDSTTEMLRNNC